MHNLKFRKADVQDAMALSRLLQKAWHHTYQGLLSAEHIAQIIEHWYTPEAVRRDILKHQHLPDEGYFVLEQDGTVLGTIGGGMVDPDTHEIFVLYLDPAHKRQGHGRRLVEALTRLALERGATRQQVCVQVGNQQGIPFYEAMGFQAASLRRPDNAVYVRDLVPVPGPLV